VLIIISSRKFYYLDLLPTIYLKLLILFYINFLGKLQNLERKNIQLLSSLKELLYIKNVVKQSFGFFNGHLGQIRKGLTTTGVAI